MKVIGSRVLLKRKEDNQELPGGLLLPDSAKKKQDRFEVISLGTSNTNEKGESVDFPVSIGDTILIDKYSAQEVEIDSEVFFLVKVSEIVAIL